MSRTPIAVIDTGTGNLRSVQKALARAGGDPIITSDPDVVRRAARVVVPGQGAFGEFVARLAERGLEDALREVIADGRPYLGLCLGLQVLYESSEEHGPVRGLGLLPGKVVRFRPTDRALKVPHMGWNQVSEHGRTEPLLAGVPSGAYFYFIHSYYVQPADPDTVALSCSYGHEFAAAVRSGNLFACQFHPEKSGEVGLRLLANFVEAT
ncbi:MAG TPA: imidazole glycerol phosphate synthase subunit HisH [Kofleriaceae bacterium]|nr:imidazole glycerol phosphate synthase subunit HisH [Kofleriaceae bacterium]